MTRTNGTVTNCAEGPGATRTVTITYTSPPSPVVLSTESEPPCPITERQFLRLEGAMNSGALVDITTEDGAIITLTTHKP